MRPALLIIAALALAGPALADVPGPKLRVTKLEQLPTPLPKPYDEKASPAQVDAAVDAAFARAKASGKTVIVDLGGNWCSWCRSLAGVMSLPEAKPFMDRNFELVTVNISSAKGLTDRNNQVLKRFKVAKVDGVPWLIVAAPDGKILASSSAVTDDKHETPQAMIDWIAQYAPEKYASKKAKS
jgi:thiol-disulfide isomerase/thioredoxin